MSRGLVDYFVVCGLSEDGLQVEPSSGRVAGVPPLQRQYSSRILCHYPSSRHWNCFDEGAIRTQCMPEGVQLSKEPSHHFSFHSLLITRENGSRQYGSVLTYHEPVTNPLILDALESHQNEYQSHSRGGSDLSQYWYFNRSSDSLYATKSLCFITSLPIFQPTRSYLEQLYAISVGNDRGSLPIESYLYNLLYETSLPGPGVTLKLHGPLDLITWRLPGNEELPLCDYSFRAFFESISLKNVLQLLTCVLLEQQILLKANDFHQLMMCAECITALLFPYVWPHVFVPILPSSQHGFLDAPVPFLMGLRMNTDSSTSELDILNKASLSSFDLDHDRLDIPEDLPPLPDSDKLYTRLADVLLQYEVNCPESVSGSCPSPPDKGDRKHSIIDALRLVTDLQTKGRGIGKEKSSNPLVTELQRIISRTKTTEGEIGGEDQTRVSPTTGLLDTDLPLTDESTDTSKDSEFSDSVRNIFCNYFVEHFMNYEQFIIMPDQSYQQWLRNREQFENFDKTAFLSDQPQFSRTFYSAFLETAMFTLFIDQKLIATWDPPASDRHVVLFDKMIEKHRQNSGMMTTPSSGTTPSDARDADISSGGLEVAPKPHLLNKQVDGSASSDLTNKEGKFPRLDSALLIQNESDKTDSHTSRIENESGQQSTRPDANKPPSTGGNGISTTQYHLKFVMQLWRESRLRVKHMLGSSSEAQTNNIEENTHIANLCDLLERIWGHGLKKRESKSSLWAHLRAFGETLCHEEEPKLSPPRSALSRSVTPDSSLPLSLNRHQHYDESHYSPRMFNQMSLDESFSPSPSSRRPSTPSLFRRRFQSSELKSLVGAILQPPPSTFLDDLKIINNMREIKTDVGRARAWVRLCLEKKTLSRHLSHLLSNTNLTRQRYRSYAFLLTDDEKEQFLLHLLSLSAGDFNCFSSAFTNTTMSYRVLVVSEGKYLGLSSACLYVKVGGEGGDSDTVAIPRGNYQVEFSCRNLGPLTCVRLSHDNSGLVRSLFVEMVLVHCITTGQTYRFNCGRYFARAEDDGSIDRFITGEKLSRTLKGSISTSALGVEDVLPTSKLNRSPKKDLTGEKLMLSDIKGTITSSVSKLIVICDNNSKETQRSKLLPLLYGNKGFVKAIENAFQLGYKCTRKFHKPLYIWDHIERVSMTEAAARQEETDGGEEGPKSPLPSYLSIVSKINGLASIGKEEKAMLFFLIGLRDHVLSDWIQIITSSSSTELMYDPVSFLRDPELISFLLDTINWTKDTSLTLEPLFAQGL
ncbi:PREDICTED: DENN domain-containing protein 5B [Amphimedon queenslandica]|uniref:UDENN domain-containing protein n=1 Tax=Amphimedon queenslandica TaxID=400682 RepID=A0A1X7VK89_AMPQE|nr:PREDICTED: DENN domain-containing protein 5B [Amphimedon queenslandica]|eukprot:XP_019864258.1 PREDICTED: DENN domain-containing protein 5B [Amphimedon queenslandica]